MIVAAREFTSSAEMRAAAIAAHKACFNPKVKPTLALALPAPKQKAIPFMARKLPEWKAKPTHFDHHVDVSLPILAMIAAGEIERTDKSPIQAIVLDVLTRFPGITIYHVKSPSRTRGVCLARMTAMWEVRQQRPDLSFPAIGRWFGGRDHTTVLHAVRKIEAMRGAA